VGTGHNALHPAPTTLHTTGTYRAHPSFTVFTTLQNTTRKLYTPTVQGARSSGSSAEMHNYRKRAAIQQMSCYCTTTHANDSETTKACFVFRDQRRWAICIICIHGPDMDACFVLYRAGMRQVATTHHTALLLSRGWPHDVLSGSLDSCSLQNVVVFPGLGSAHTTAAPQRHETRSADHFLRPCTGSTARNARSSGALVQRPITNFRYPYRNGTCLRRIQAANPAFPRSLTLLMKETCHS
jgi:hypothetical protein